MPGPPARKLGPQVFRAWVRSPQFRNQLFDWGIELILNSSWLHENYVIACGSRYFCYTKDHFETKILMMNAFWRFDRLVPSFPTTRAKLPGIASFDHPAILLKCSEFSSARSKDFIRYYTGRLYILAKTEHEGWLSNIQLRILFCFLYNRAILKGNIYYLHSWILNMCSVLKFEFAATI
jgi:hypothetical protein